MKKKYTEFGCVIRRARLYNSLTQRALARRVRLEGEYMSRVDRGQQLPAVRTLARLRHVLGFDGNELLGTLNEPVRAMPPRTFEPGAARREVREPCDGPARFGDALRQARISKGITQKDVAHAVRRAEGFVQRIESGRALPSIPTLARLWRVLDVDANILLDELYEEVPRKTPYSCLGRLLETAREALEMTPEEVAQALGCQVSTYERTERGQRLPSVVRLARIRDILRLDGDAVLDAVLRGDTPEDGAGE